MLKYSENNRDIIESDEGFSIENQGINTIIYKEGDKSIAFYREFMAGSSDVFLGGEINKWNSGEPTDKPTCDRILENVKRAFAFKGSKITIRINNGLYINGKSTFPGEWPGRC